MTSLENGLSAHRLADAEDADFAAAAVPAAIMDSANTGAAGGFADRGAAVRDESAATAADDAPPRTARQVLRPLGYTPRRAAGLSGYERVLARAGLAPVAGLDEAGRGACAGPLVVAAVVFPGADPPVPQLADSKALTPAVREQVYREVVAHALSWHVVVIPPAEIDRLGLHVCNIAGMRRALAGLSGRPGYALTDGFPVSGLPVPALAMWKGDQVAGCVAAASVVAKVTRDHIMTGLHDRYPGYDFAEHKGYSTPRHSRALARHGPCPEHRMSFVNVMSAAKGHGTPVQLMADNGEMADDVRSMECAGAEAAANGARSAAAGNGAGGVPDGAAGAGDGFVRIAAAANGEIAGGPGDTAWAEWAEETSGDS
jgi:ribonuclease HII